ncbi:MAG: ABC transporter [Actinobacteria bacterium HGW-Actinobacteria-2]|nr:MAG: ABC transporter [Actinobacteria bacterium HGW-Actinobacteria-2]
MLIEVRGASVSFGSREVFAEVDMTFPDAEVSALIGPSGSGKSTMLGAVSGQLKLDRGHVRWGAASDAGSEPDPDLVAWVPQSASLLGHRSCVENVALAGLCRGLPRSAAMEMAHELLADFGLSKVALTPAGRASGGERQRICVCRALATGRPLVIADEPSANLDAANTDLVLAAFARLAGSGVTVIAASHDPAIVGVVSHVEYLR